MDSIHDNDMAGMDGLFRCDMAGMDDLIGCDIEHVAVTWANTVYGWPPGRTVAVSTAASGRAVVVTTAASGGAAEVCMA